MAVGPAAIFVRLADAPPIPFAFYRLSIATAVLGLALGPAGWSQVRAMDRRSFAWCGLAGVLLAIHFGAWISSLYYTSVSNSVLIIATQPVFAAVFGVVFLRERVSGPMCVAIGLALVGAIIVGSGTSGSGGDAGTTGRLGDGLALLGAIAVGAYLVVGRYARRELSTLTYATLAYGVAAIVLGLWACGLHGMRGGAMGGYDAATWGWIAAAALGPSVVGHTLYNRALRHLPAHVVSTSILGEPVVATALAWLILDEAPGPWVWAGGLPIVVGVWLALKLSRADADVNLPRPPIPDAP